MSQRFLLSALLMFGLSTVLVADDGGAASEGTSEWDRFTPLIEKFTTDYPVERAFATVAIGISSHEERRYWQVGDPIVKGAGQPVPAERTLYQIGSVTKTFTGLLLAAMVEEGLVTLDTTIGELKPDDVELSEDMAGITLRELATHSSGLPRLTGDLTISSLFSPENPYAEYNTEKLWAALETTTIPPREDRVYLYSNLAMGLLGQLLADRAGTDYAALLQSRVTDPLALGDTIIELSDEQLTRLAPGHAAEGTECTFWTFDSLAGCGALSSTTADLLTYLEAELQPDTSPLGPAIRLSQVTHYEAPGGRPTLGLGWHMLPLPGTNRVYAHDGGTNGYVSFTAFIPDTQTAVVILCNSGDALSSNHMIGRLGVELLRASQEEPVETVKEGAEINQNE